MSNTFALPIIYWHFTNCVSRSTYLGQYRNLNSITNFTPALQTHTHTQMFFIDQNVNHYAEQYWKLAWKVMRFKCICTYITCVSPIPCRRYLVFWAEFETFRLKILWRRLRGGWQSVEDVVMAVTSIEINGSSMATDGTSSDRGGASTLIEGTSMLIEGMAMLRWRATHLAILRGTTNDEIVTRPNKI